MTHLHFIGIGGIGMSGLAAMCADSGYTVTGSDRGAERPENRRIIDALELQGIRIYPQDGSYIRDGRPDLLVYSTAIEEGNADFAAGAGIDRIHRSQLLERVIRESGFECSIAVTGSCGDCTSPDCICCQMVITRACRPAGRIKVILVGEDLGF